MNSRKLFIILSSLLLAITGCDKIKSMINPKKQVTRKAESAITVKGTLIAKVNNIPVTLEDMNEEIEAYNSMVPADKPEQKITTREQRINYLKTQMVRRLLLYQDAMDKGLDRKEEVIKAIDKTKQELLVMQLLRQEADSVDVSSKEIEDYYNTYKEQLKEPEERQIREIVVATEPEAKDILIQLLQGGDFTALAKDRSKSASAKDGGDLGFLATGKKFPQFDAVAFSDTLEVGKTSNILKGPDGYYLLKLEAKRGGKEKTLTEMWDDIKRGLVFLKQQQKIEDTVGKLSRDAKLEFYESQIK